MTQSAGGRAGIAYAGGITDNAANGNALCLRPFWIVEGWLSGPIQVSREFGKRSGWPGGTSGISMQPMARSGREQDSSGVIISWGSASQRATGPAPLSRPCYSRARRRARFPFGGGRRPPDPPGSPTKANRHKKLGGAPDSERRPEILACSADSRCVISLDLGDARTPADLVGLDLRPLVGGCRADWDTLYVETAGVVSMASMCHRSGQGAGCFRAAQVTGGSMCGCSTRHLLEDLRRLGMEARPR